MKKVLSILLTTAMLASTAVTAFAAEGYPIKFNGKDSNLTTTIIGETRPDDYCPLSVLAKKYGYSLSIDKENESFTVSSPYKTVTYTKAGDESSVTYNGLVFDIYDDVWVLRSDTEPYDEAIYFMDEDVYIPFDAVAKILGFSISKCSRAASIYDPKFGYDIYIDGENVNWSLATIKDIDYSNRTVTLDDTTKGTITAKLNNEALLDIGNLAWSETFDYTQSGHMRVEHHVFHANKEFDIYELTKGTDVRVIYDDNNNIDALYKNGPKSFTRIHGTVKKSGWICEPDFCDANLLPYPRFNPTEDEIDDIYYVSTKYDSDTYYYMIEFTDGNYVAIAAEDSEHNEYTQRFCAPIVNQSLETITDLTYLDGKEIDVAIYDEHDLYAGEYEASLVVVQEEHSPASVTQPVVSQPDETPSEPAATPSSDEVSVTLNGNAVTFDQPPVIIDGRTLVPMRAIFEAMSCEVTWDGDTKTIEAFDADGNKVIKMQVGSADMWSVSNPSITLDVPPQIINDRTLVPVRAISESMGAEVIWHGDTRNVEIIYN